MSATRASITVAPTNAPPTTSEHLTRKNHSPYTGWRMKRKPVSSRPNDAPEFTLSSPAVSATHGSVTHRPTTWNVVMENAIPNARMTTSVNLRCRRVFYPRLAAGQTAPDDLPDDL